MADDFLTTRWSLVFRATREAGEEGRRALEALCESYWYPVYAYVAGRGGEEDPLDLTQEFFARFLERPEALRPDPDKGRFRAYLLGSVRHFLSNERDRARAGKRGGGRSPLSLDVVEVERRVGGPAGSEDPERAFERSWARVLLSRVFARLEADYRSGGKERQFELLRQVLIPESDAPSYRSLAEELDTTEGAVKVAVHRLRERFGRALREEILETLQDRGEVEDEIRHLFRALRGE